MRLMELEQNKVTEARIARTKLEIMTDKEMRSFRSLVRGFRPEEYFVELEDDEIPQ